MSGPPLPPVTRETAVDKVRLAEHGWNTRDAAKVALAYTSYLTVASEFVQGSVGGPSARLNRADFRDT